ncbi:MAG: glycosyl transferase [unclassified Hahellaceae]|nr:glycosyl transferase [Hahellaceae bacterium]|tara:strand:- start:48048 stop:49580 length:1533 start_codon:yes stop_codon:yes gene_type:complete
MATNAPRASSTLRALAVQLFGWGCLFATLFLLAAAVDPAYVDSNSGKFIFVLGAIGVWRYGNAITHYVRALAFLHITFPRFRSRTDALGDDALPSEFYMVVTSFRIPVHTTHDVYRSVFMECANIPRPITIIASIVERGDERLIIDIFRSIAADNDHLTLKIVRARGTGKRDGLAHAFRALSRCMPAADAVVGVVDGDTRLEHDSIIRAVSCFSLLPNVGGLTTNEFCEVEGSRIMKQWHSMRFAQRHINMCSMALSHRVLTMTGRLSFFRAAVLTHPDFIRDVEADFLEHWRLGRFQFLTGDDKSSWFSLMSQGWDTFYVPDSLTLTIEHPPSDSFFEASRQLMYRWYGNSLRQNFRATRALGLRRLGLFTTYVLYDQRLSMWTCLLGLSVSVTAGLMYSIQFLLVYLLWVAISRTIVALLFVFTGHSVDPVYPLMLYYNQIVGSAMKIYSMFHLDQQSWTRQKTTLNKSTVSFDARLNKVSSKAMLFSSFSIFAGAVALLIDISIQAT